MEDLKLPSCPEASITKSKVEKLVKKAINKANEMDIRHSIEWENETSEHCEGNMWVQTISANSATRKSLHTVQTQTQNDWNCQNEL